MSLTFHSMQADVPQSLTTKSGTKNAQLFSDTAWVDLDDLQGWLCQRDLDHLLDPTISESPKRKPNPRSVRHTDGQIYTSFEFLARFPEEYLPLTNLTTYISELATGCKFGTSATKTKNKTATLGLLGDMAAIFDCMFITAYCNSIGNSTIAPNDTISRCFNNPAVGSSRHIYRSEYGNNGRSPQRFQLRLHAGYNDVPTPPSAASFSSSATFLPFTSVFGFPEFTRHLSLSYFALSAMGFRGNYAKMTSRPIGSPLPAIVAGRPKLGSNVHCRLPSSDSIAIYRISSRFLWFSTRPLAGVMMRFCELEHGWKYCAGFVSQLASATASYAHDDPVFDVYTSTHRQHEAASDLGLLLQRLYAYAYNMFQ
ncbi:hypothetical protein C8J57DRAFT_1594070 [Mycena rebaudengoi]|nr:hypothetical protein C8J57DRAFT_1594070 [Mycena rebaudengoi]